MACGTRTLIDAVFGPTTGETTYTPALLRSLRPGMILLADRNFGAKALLADIAGTGAELLVRLKNGRRMPVLARYRDGSYLSMLGAVRVRVIEAEITIHTTAGRRTGTYRLATTLLDHRRYPAAELITLYHQRWGATRSRVWRVSSRIGGYAGCVAPDQCSRSVPALTCVGRFCLLRGAKLREEAQGSPFRPGKRPGEGKAGRVNASEPLMMPRDGEPGMAG